MNNTVIDESSLSMSKGPSEDDWSADLDPLLEGGTYKVAFNR